MPQVPIIMPQLGESIAEATVVEIKVKPGDEVAVDQEIIDVETNKAVMGVTTPCKGKSVTIKDLENFLGGIEKQTLSEASAIRAGVADAMRRSWSRPLATIGSSVKLDPVLQDRQSRDPKPGPALYAVRALALALAENPNAAAKLIGIELLDSTQID